MSGDTSEWFSGKQETSRDKFVRGRGGKFGAGNCGGPGRPSGSTSLGRRRSTSWSQGRFATKARVLIAKTMGVVSAAKAMKPHRGKRLVYFIGNQNVERIKIGSTTNCIRRFRDLLFMSPLHLSVFMVLAPEDDGSLETCFHAMFDDYRTHGEWFHFSDAIRDFISFARKGGSGGSFEILRPEKSKTLGAHVWSIRADSGSKYTITPETDYQMVFDEF